MQVWKELGCLVDWTEQYQRLLSAPRLRPRLLNRSKQSPLRHRPLLARVGVGIWERALEIRFCIEIPGLQRLFERLLLNVQAGVENLGEIGNDPTEIQSRTPLSYLLARRRLADGRTEKLLEMMRERLPRGVAL